MRIRSLSAAVLAGILAAGAFLAGTVRGTDRAEASGASPGAKDVIVHLFEWPWASIANECTNVLGPKGFGGVQVSPPQEHVVLPSRGYPWWQDYQPVSYQLTTRRGNRAAFAAMVSTCHAAGVKIYVDAVINHMAGGASTGAGSGGSTYSHYAYPNVPYGDGDFHHCGRNGNDDIANYSDRWEVQNCELVDLSDLETEASYVRGKLIGYLNDLRSLGVDGFRVDAAKHMPAADLQAIYGGLSGGPYIFQEVTRAARASRRRRSTRGSATSPSSGTGTWWATRSATGTSTTSTTWRARCGSRPATPSRSSTITIRSGTGARGLPTRTVRRTGWPRRSCWRTPTACRR